ncbi:piggyBac transposable element-derived protein 4-like [Pseudomyrmex gracilis]|uniref:piggyBac transposable element-derived protein 4-like n=1 Tax=Pseudomyrmex gracilis TaxID=219809 RepID=UPI000994B799|nr:piggyBac transposable element-derived protein 4-like [Pseudomyrmex gracilis]
MKVYYFGKGGLDSNRADTDYRKFGLGVTGDIVAHFLEPYHRQGRVVYVDNWYTSPALAECLHDRDTGLCGTVKANRKGMPKLENKLSRRQIQVAHTDVWMAMKWEDKRSVRMLSTVHEVDFCPTGKKRRGTDEDIMKPTCIHDCNQNMGGADNVNRQLSITETVRKTMKWYRKLFFHLVDLCLSNAHAMYKMRNAGPAPFPEFRLEVVRALLKLTPGDSSMPKATSSVEVEMAVESAPPNLDPGLVGGPRGTTPLKLEDQTQIVTNCRPVP